MRQVEVSRTIVFDAPRRARGFFEALIADNLDIGRPASVQIIFGRRVQRNTTGVFKTAIDRPAVGPDTGGVVLNVFYKHSRVKQYVRHEAHRASLYPRHSWEEFGGLFLGRGLTRIRKEDGKTACPESSGRLKASRAGRCKTRVIGQKLDCLKPNLHSV